MLDVFLQAVPNVLAAAAILLIAWFLGRFVAGLVTRLLANLGFDRIPERIGLGHAFASNSAATTTGAPAPSAGNVTTTATADTGGTSLSDLAGHLALFFIMLFATVEAAALLGFGGVRDLLETFIAFGADILLGLVIFVVGYWLANVAAVMLRELVCRGISHGCSGGEDNFCSIMIHEPPR